MRGRPRKPTLLLEASGAFDRNPQRRKEREGEPVLPLGVGDPPKQFDASEVECWKELAERGAVWLTAGDAPVLEQTAKLLARSRRNELKTADAIRLDKNLERLGFGPIARTHIKVPNATPKSKLAKFA